MYSLDSIDDKENEKAKGVNKNVVKNTRHKEFVVLFNKKTDKTQNEKNLK